MGRGLFGDFRG
uniref:Uncharacterized protein n=1 Tax=Arundo donax TaxID=35708 RepID=A0A0A9BYW7_ARUDO